MSPQSEREIFSSRVVDYPVELVYRAFAEPTHLKEWWGPHGFTNTIHEFDLQPGGKWLLTMHGPEVGNYQNESVFQVVKHNERVAWKRISQPLFDMEVAFEKMDHSSSRISFRMTFDSVEACNKIRSFAGPKNEENFDRLEQELARM
ncbi:MAG: SRPBCC domain-containing protein [Flavobacteriales bacterium]|nr:SRPBCC domain-containing protein [Flavobacteriales bacterium]